MRIFLHYLSYLFRARHRKGHGIHSPFVFDFVSNVLNGSDPHEYEPVNRMREELLKDRRMIHIDDQGAGSRKSKSNVREIRQIVKTSVVKPKYGRLLARLASWYKPGLIIELGTGLGISTFYLSAGYTECKVCSIEGSEKIMEVAREKLKSSGLRNLELINGLFSDELPGILDRTGNKKNILVFIDGDHSGTSVLKYCDLLLERSFGEMVIILDDIYWSLSMVEAWKKLIDRPEINVSIDLFQFGILFVKKGVSKQHYMIRF